MLEKRRRWCSFYEIHLPVITRADFDIEGFVMQEIYEMIKPRFDKKESYYKFNNESAAIRLQDMKLDHDNQILHLLVNYADKNIADPVFSDLETGKLRTEFKLEGEGVAVSTHISISMLPSRTGGFLCLCENAPGVGKAKLERFFTAECRESDEGYTVTSDDGTVYKCRPDFDMQMYAGKSLKEFMDTSFLNEVELIRYHKESPDFDEKDTIKQTTSVVKLKVISQRTGNPGVDLIKSIQAKALKNQFSTLRIKIKENTGKSKWLGIGVTNSDIGATLFSKDVIIITRHPVPQCSESIHSELMDKLTKVLTGERKKNV